MSCDDSARCRLAAGLTIDERGGLVQIYVAENQRGFAMAGLAAELILAITSAVQDGVDTCAHFVDEHAAGYDVDSLEYAWEIACRSGMLVPLCTGIGPSPVNRSGVAVTGPADPASVDYLCRELQDLDVLVVGTEDDPQLVIGLDDIGDEWALIELGRTPPHSGAPWLPVQVLDHVTTLGPLIYAGESACFECAVTRRAANLAPDGIRRWGQQRLQRVGQIDRRAGLKIASVFVLAQISRLLANEPPPLLARRVVHDLSSGAQHMSFVLEVPGCATCRLTDPVLA